MANKMIEYGCRECSHRTAFLHQTSVRIEGVWFDTPEPPVTIACERCGHTASPVPSAPYGRVARADFFDAGAGRRFKSEGEHTQWCRENGVSEDNGGGRFYFEERRRARAAAAAKDEAAFNEYADRLKNDPSMASVRDLMARGYFKDRAERELQRQGEDRPVEIQSASSLLEPTP